MKTTESLVTELKRLHCSNCNLHHEKIPLDKDSLPVKLSSNESGFQRKGLCSETIRENNISCAHTTARIKLKQFISGIPEVLLNANSRNNLLQKVRDLEFRIVQTDIKKSDAEVSHAVLIDELNKSDLNTHLIAEKLANSKAKIQQIIAQHNLIVAEFRELLKEALAIIETAEITT